MIHITGDTHGEWGDIKNRINSNCNDGDTIIICGDFGFIFYPNIPKFKNLYFSEQKKLKKLIKLLNDKNVTLCFVDGNHENFDRLSKYKTIDKYGGKVREISENIFQLKRGEVFNIENKSFFVMGGADSIDKNSRIENETWWKEEIPNKKDEDNGLDNLFKVDFKVDYILTHTIFEELIDKLDIFKYRFKNSLDGYFTTLNDRVEFDKWFFGHFHVDKLIHHKYHCLYLDVISL